MQVGHSVLLRVSMYSLVFFIAFFEDIRIADVIFYIKY